MEIVHNLKQTAYFTSHRWLGMDIGREYKQLLCQDRQADASEIRNHELIHLIDHCRNNVPYYRDIMATRDISYRQDPERYLADFPLLTKSILRQNFERLKSSDLNLRKWHLNTSGGSTGEPARFVQDHAFNARVGALQWLSHAWAGRSFGEPAVRVWGSMDDVLKGTMTWKGRIINFLTNDTWFNAFRMSPERMRSFLEQLNRKPPQLITGYAQSLFDLARFAEQEQIPIAPQKSVLTSAGMLYPFMREKIESYFQCKVFDRYGSREVGDIACECEEHNGLHVFPQGNYVEVVDEEGYPLPPGEEGQIAITNLSNYAMPLIRYIIGDRGILSPETHCSCGRNGQILSQISGRVIETFIKEDGTLIDAAYFVFLLYFLDWVEKFQIIQTDHTEIVYRIQRSQSQETPQELEDIREKTRLVMGPDCKVHFDFVEDIAPSPSGKYLYLKSEVHA